MAVSNSGPSQFRAKVGCCQPAGSRRIIQFILPLALVLTANSPLWGNENEIALPSDVSQLLEANNVRWDVPGPASAESMPIGNGDIGLNVWTETNGAVAFYIAKTDAWNEDVRGSAGLMKLGEVRLALEPNPFAPGAPFEQTLDLRKGEIKIKEGAGAGAVTFRIWVDANNPVIRVEVAAPGQPVSLTATLIDWRLAPKGGSNPDLLVSGQTHRIVWYHRNRADADPHVAGLTFGAALKGEGLVAKDATSVTSAAAAGQTLLSIYPLAETTSTPDQWVASLEGQIARIDQLNVEQSRLKHEEWWDQFWRRSWLFVDGDAGAQKVTQGYILQRFVTACAGRGKYPVKFNGSLFVVDDPAKPNGKDATGKQLPPSPVNADYRTWGGQYWFQNTRPMYWPRLQAGDFDLMLPLFKMYAGMLPENSALVKKYYNHEGVYFAETAPFWGGMRYWGPEVKEDWTGHYFTPILELSMMMLDYYEYTGDRQFAREILLPVAAGGLQFFDQHFGRDALGKILLDPDNAIEMYWKVHDPAPDIAGLRAILPRMLALPDGLATDAQRGAWQRMLKELPDLPRGMREGKNSLLPYTGEQTVRSRNGENPELYAVYPFRLFGLAKPDLQLALDTFETRKCKQKGCWVQDPVQAAMLGLADVAEEYVRFNFTRSDPRLKFPAFWVKGNDYAPDEDNGGNGENGLQQMVLQAVGKKILLLPAWPKNWNATFKLHAPFETTVQGTVRNGKLTGLIVNPPDRKADIVDMSF